MLQRHEQEEHFYHNKCNGGLSWLCMLSNHCTSLTPIVQDQHHRTSWTNFAQARLSLWGKSLTTLMLPHPPQAPHYSVNSTSFTRAWLSWCKLNTIRRAWQPSRYLANHRTSSTARQPLHKLNLKAILQGWLPFINNLTELNVSSVSFFTIYSIVTYLFCILYHHSQR
jgi:hypothetical protein